MQIVRLNDCYGQIQAVVEVEGRLERWGSEAALRRGDWFPLDSLIIAVEVVPQTIWNPPDKISVTVPNHGRIWLFRLS